MPRIFDCFTYCNEEEILRIRLEELGDVVDSFVIVEGLKTFTLKPKPLYFDNIGSWIDKWRPQIVRHVVDLPTHLSPWECEKFQRNQILRGLRSVGLKSEDKILISDADEIPRPEVLSYVGDPIQLDVTQYFWNFNWQVPHHCNQGARPVLLQAKDLDSPQSLRASDLRRIPHAGWHFSFFGTEEMVRNKIESFAHTEMDTEEFKSLEHIQKCIELGLDPFERFPLKYTSINATYPKYVQRVYNV